MSTEIILGEGLLHEGRPIRVGRNPELAWRLQSRMLTGNYAVALGATPQEYERELEELLREDFIRRAKNSEGTSTLLIVEPRIALPEMLEIVRIGTFFDPQKVKVEDWLVEGGFETPNKPYVTRLDFVPNKSVMDVRIDSLEKKDKRGGTIFEGIAFYQRDPRILNNFFLKFPGSQVGHDNAPFLFVFSDNNPLLSYGDIESASPKFACVVASKI